MKSDGTGGRDNPQLKVEVMARGATDTRYYIPALDAILEVPTGTGPRELEKIVRDVAAHARLAQRQLGDDARDNRPAPSRYLVGHGERFAYTSHSLMVDLLMPPAMARDFYANVEECFPLWVERHGMRRARWIARFQAWNAAVGYRVGQLLDVVERFARAIRPG